MNDLTNDQMNALVSKHKAALTRAKKKGPQAVIKAVDDAMAEWDAKLPAWPDNWSLWQRAKDDALFEIQRNQPVRF